MGHGDENTKNIVSEAMSGVNDGLYAQPCEVIQFT